MFFKRIEAVGFKSFATKTVCDFIPGTTVIVGPNGCGKSNIFDAIKWVFGEQAASQLRGKKMQDVIFAGSASFKALGVAQVTVTIDNSRRILPIDYEEVQITRRLFRSGESEYLLNKTACRLRDIHDLLLGTGIGKSAYSMLEQGRVDQIINAKPQERRFLIEEAAGISKFKIRKLEALRKLERTDIDLSRLNDLLGEVERQVNSLKRQANKAERFKDLFDSCRRAEQELMVLRSAELRNHLRELETSMNEYRDKLAALRTELAEKSAAEELARDHEDELNENLRDESQALFDLKANLTTCGHQITRLNDQIGEHARRIERIQEEFKELDLRAAELKLRIEETELRAKSSEEARQAHQNQFETMRQQYADLEENVANRNRRIEELGTEVGRLRDTVSRTDNEIRTAEALIERQSQDQREAEALYASLEETCLAQMINHEELENQSKNLNEVIDKIEAEVETQRQAQTERQGRLAGQLRDLEQTRQQLHAGRSRLDTLNELRASYEGYYQGVREVMLAADRHEVSGILGVAANLIRASKDYEVAIEVALATHLQDIVTNTAEDAKQAIEYLKRWGRGRATFLPLDRLQPTPLAQNLRDVLRRPGVLGLASELVEYDRQIRTAVDFMLGTTIVVKDLDVGLELGRQGYRARYVSLDGQLINPGGSMTGGRVQATGLMSREREIRDLERTVQELDAKQESLRKQIEQVQIELADGHGRIEALQAELSQRSHERTALMKDLESAERGRAEAERALAERKGQMERLELEVAAKQESIQQWQAQRETAGRQLFEAEQMLNEERQTARNQGEDFRDLGTSVAQARAEMEKARDRIADAERELQVLERDLESITRQRQTRQREIEQLNEEDVLLQEQITRIQGETDAIRVEYDVMSHRLNEDQATREELTVQLKQLSQDVERLTRDERSQDNEFREIELRHTELHANLGNISEQCQEKFSQELDQLAEAVGEVDKDPQALHAEVVEMREKLDRIGLVNMAALEEYQEQTKRLDFLQGQRKDLTEAKEQLETTIAKLDETTRKLFHETFEAVRGHFIEMFRRLFNGGKADLILDAPEGMDPLLDGGIEIVAQPPGKKLQSITLMSGGEKALTAIALLFGLFLYKPSPFCILDEIDAPLDDINVERFKTVLREFAQNTQFLIITHNKLTMELADAIYGVTMEESGVSKLVSVRFEQAEDMVDAV